MAHYRTKPLVIEAWHCSRLLYLASNDFWNLPKRIISAYDNEGLLFLSKSIDIYTPNGRVMANYGDLVIHGVGGQLYPCTAAIFSQTYELEETL